MDVKEVIRIFIEYKGFRQGLFTDYGSVFDYYLNKYQKELRRCSMFESVEPENSWSYMLCQSARYCSKCVKEIRVMKNKLKSMLKETITSWSETDIYAISLWVQDEDDNPSKPTVTLGYNTEKQFQQSFNETDEREARWNFAFWLQNEELCFGRGETAEDVKNWILENGLSVYGDDEDCDDEQYEEIEQITELFVNILIAIVKELHEEKFLTAKFGKEIPILIHELEYYEEIAKQNVKANGEILDKEFIDFCLEG